MKDHHSPFNLPQIDPLTTFSRTKGQIYQWEKKPEDPALQLVGHTASGNRLVRNPSRQVNIG